MEIPKYSWWHSRHYLIVYAKTFDKAATLVPKQSRVWGFTEALLTYATTIGRKVYIPYEWTKDQAASVISHEVLGHVKQFRFCAFGRNPTFGILPMAVIYFFVFFPVLLAWGRYRLELHAFTVDSIYKLEQGMKTPKQILEHADRFANNISGKPYVYAIPRKWAKWGFRRRARKIIQNHEKAE